MFAYDAFGRQTLAKRSARTYVAHPSEVCDGACPAITIARHQYAYPTYPLSPSQQLVIAEDSSNYQFDPHSGLLLEADNGDAQIARTYYPNGSLLTETQHVRTVAGPIEAGVHAYTLTYEYDRNGRRVRLGLPTVVRPTALDGTVLGTAHTYGYEWNTGALEQVTNALGQTTTALYTARGELDTLRLPGALVVNAFDADARLHHVTANALGTALTLRNTTLDYDARDKLVTMTGTAGPRETLTSAYSGLGHVTATHSSSTDPRNTNNTVTSTESFVHSALGDNVRSTTSTTLRYWLGGTLGAGGESWTPSARATQYQAATGRLLSDTTSGRIARYEYDASGSTLFMGADGPGAHPAREERATYYAADGQLRMAEVRTRSDASAATGYERTVEEYGYDALGRRVLVRTRRACGNPASGAQPFCALGTVRRTLWDGSATLAEIQQPGGEDEAPAVLENDGPLLGTVTTASNTDPNPFFGTSLYSYGFGGTDQPLTVTRLHYRDAPTGGALTAWAPFTIVPLWNALGQADQFVYANGTQHWQNQGREVILGFPAGWFAYYRRGYQPFSWHGSLLEDKRDGSGLHDRRNRAYDPMTGRFTQEDPIGLAGGLNLYGFAGGDPVNFSDPFGLCPPNDKDWTTCSGFFTLAGAAAGALIGGTGGGAGGAALCAVGGPVAIACAAGGGAAGAMKGGAAGAIAGAALDGLVHFAKKRDIGQIEDAAKRSGMNRDQRREFGDYVEGEKAAGRFGDANNRGDFSFKDLMRLAKEFLKLEQ